MFKNSWFYSHHRDKLILNIYAWFQFADWYNGCVFMHASICPFCICIWCRVTSFCIANANFFRYFDNCTQCTDLNHRRTGLQVKLYYSYSSNFNAKYPTSEIRNAVLYFLMFIYCIQTCAPSIFAGLKLLQYKKWVPFAIEKLSANEKYNSQLVLCAVCSGITVYY